jgi:nitrogen fixation protein NifU and related proteins
MDIYRELILDHYKHPRNFGVLKNPTASSQAYNATCGDKIVMEIKVSKDKKIEDVRFSGVGCAISQASASLITEKVKGMDLGKVLKLTGDDVLDLLGTTLTPSRMKCATLPLEVLHKAILVVH